MENINLIEKLRKVAHESDYYPMGGSLIYKAQEYFYAKKNGLPTEGIKIVEIIPNSDLNDFIEEECGIIYESDPTKIHWYE